MEPSTNKPRPVYTCDVSDSEWEFCQQYLELMRPDAQFPLRELFNALRDIVRCECQWRLIPDDLPPWQVVYQQAQRGMKAGCFEVTAYDLRELAHVAKGRKPTAAIMDGHTMQSSTESGAGAGYDGYKKRNGSKVHIAVDTPWSTCLLSKSLQPTSRNGHKLGSLPRPATTRDWPQRSPPCIG